MDIGFVGGADGPTKIFVASGIDPYGIALIAALCIAAAGIIIWAVKRHKRVE